MEDFIGVIKLFAGNYEPQGWLICDGRLLNISQNAALFSIIGVTYGGDGKTTFALPDLRGRVPVGFGQSPGLSNYAIGEKKGAETNTLTSINIPTLKGTVDLTALKGTATGTVQQSIPVEIAVPCSTAGGGSPEPENCVMGVDTSAGMTPYATSPETGKFMQPLKATVQVNASASLPVTLDGGSVNITINKDTTPVPVNNLQPTLGLNYIICVYGVFPNRNF